MCICMYLRGGLFPRDGTETGQPAEVSAAEQPAVAPAEQPVEQLAQQPEVAQTAVAQLALAEPEAQPAEQPAKRRCVADRLRDLA